MSTYLERPLLHLPIIYLYIYLQYHYIFYAITAYNYHCTLFVFGVIHNIIYFLGGCFVHLRRKSTWMIVNKKPSNGCSPCISKKLMAKSGFTLWMVYNGILWHLNFPSTESCSFSSGCDGRDSKSIKILVFTKSAIKNTQGPDWASIYQNAKVYWFTGKNSKTYVYEPNLCGYIII